MSDDWKIYSKNKFMILKKHGFSGEFNSKKRTNMVHHIFGHIWAFDSIILYSFIELLNMYLINLLPLSLRNLSTFLVYFLTKLRNAIPIEYRMYHLVYSVLYGIPHPSASSYTVKLV